MSKSNDRALRFYNEVLGLENLHYGLFLPEDDLSLKSMHIAQERYKDYLIENIPEKVTSILDVGCGTGSLVKKLTALSYDAEGLSPDINQKKVFAEKTNAKFHHMPFEDFSEADKFDLIIMSESCQYIDPDKIFENTRRALKGDGYLMICDYFVLNKGTDSFSKSGHHFDSFMETVKASNFTVVTDTDITDDVLKTLDLAKDLLNKARIGFDIAKENIVIKYPLVSKLIAWLFRKKLQKLSKQSELLDSAKFKEKKTYRFILLKAETLAR